MEEKIINIQDYELSGGGKFGESYIKRDNPNILLKLYPTELEQMGLDEFDRAWKVYKTGLPCPEPGELVRTSDGSLGILFKRIIGKKSFAAGGEERRDRHSGRELRLQRQPADTHYLHVCIAVNHHTVTLVALHLLPVQEHLPYASRDIHIAPRDIKRDAIPDILLYPRSAAPGILPIRCDTHDTLKRRGLER